MSNAYLSPILNDAQFNDDGTFLVGGLIWFYEAGSTTPLLAYTDETASVAWSNPIVLNARGETGGEIWLAANSAYKIILQEPPAYGETQGVTISTFDNISGVNDVVVSISQDQNWFVFNGLPVYLSATSFSVAGDQRAIFQTARRLKTVNNSGTVYSSIVSATYTSPSTTIVVTNDSSPLDVGLSSVSYGFIETNPSSIPTFVNLLPLTGGTLTGNLTVTPSAANSTEISNFTVTRNADYFGGTPGYVNGAIRATVNVGAAVTDYEWAITGIVNNYASGGQNVGVYGQGNRFSGSGPTWGGVMQVWDQSGLSDPITGTVGLEVDVAANGTDVNGSRCGIDVALGKGIDFATAPTVGYGVRVSAYFGDPANATVTSAFSVFSCTYKYGFDLIAGTMTADGCAIRIKENTPIAFGGTSDAKLMFYNTTFSALEYNPGTATTRSTSYIRLLDTGAISMTGTLIINGNQILQNRILGYTPMTGTPDASTAYAISSVTLQQLAARVASIQASLTTHGLIGP